MVLDLVFIVMLIVALVKGYSRGLIVAVFSVVAFIAGLAAAVKLSAVAATYLSEHINISPRWLPFISFLVVFLLVVWLVRVGAKVIEQVVQFAMLGWLNRFGGIVFYLLLYSIIYSILLFYLTSAGLINEETIQQSKVYPYLKSIGPFIIDQLGILLPWFKNMFGTLQEYFKQWSPGGTP